MLGLGLRKKIKKYSFYTLNAKESLIRSLVEKSAKKNFQKNGIKDIPVVINNFNRYEVFVQLVDWLRSAGSKNIIVLDNNSTYSPLLEYYKRNTFCNIIHLGANLGHKALWKSGLYKKIRNGYFCYSDADLIPVAECPKDLVNYLLELLWKYPEVVKVGPGLRLSDIPDHYEHKRKVLAWESKYWNNPVEENVYKAALDTTFALYRPRTLHNTQFPALRTGEPYVMHHSPWYEDANRLTDEEIFYRSKASRSSWWSSLANEGPNRVFSKDKVDL